MLSNISKKNLVVFKLTIFLSLILPFFVLTIAVIAEGEGGEGGGDGSACQNGYMLCTSPGGAGWKYYYTNSNNVWTNGYADDGNHDYAPRTNIVGCAPDGGYWRYAMIAQKDGTVNGEQVYKNSQVGVVGIGGSDSSFISRKFGTQYGMAYRDDLSAYAGNWEKVQEIYTHLQSIKPEVFQKGWNASSGLGWFCGSENKEPPEPTTDYTTGDDTGSGTVKVTLDYHNVSATGGSNQNGAYTLPKETSSTTVTFSNNLKGSITSNPHGQLGNAQINDAVSRALSSRNHSIPNSNIVTIPNNGDSQTLSQIVSWTTTYTYRYSITYHYKTVTTYNIDGSVANTTTTLESTTYGIPYYYSSSGSASDTKNITIYRMAEAVTSVKSYIKSTVNGGTTTENPQESSIIARRDDTPKETHVGTSTRIYADSSSQDKTISLNFIHTVFRGNNNSRSDLETYDLRNVSSKTVKIPWSVTGTSGTDTGTGTFESSSIPGSREVKSSTFSVKNGKNSESSSTNRISLGTFNKEICQTLSSSGTINITYPSSNSTNNTTADGIASKACAHLYRPYNFDLYPTATIDNAAATNSVGEEMSIDWRVENKTNSVPNQEGTHSYSPENTKVRVIGFVVSRELSDNNVGDKLNGGDFSYDNTCNFYKDKLGAYFKTGECAIIKEENFTNGILISGANGSTQNYIPNHLDVGDKVCYATAVNYIDSNYNPTGNGLGYGTMNSGRWRISNASCKSTAKRPNFRVLGGSVYGSGNVSGAITKIRNEHDGSYDVFGSWVDFGIVSNGNISYVASGASLAEGHDITNENIPYTCEENNPLSVANKNCNNGTGSGRAGIFFNSTTIDRIVSHYSGNILAKNQQAFSGNVNLSTDFVKFTDKYYTTVGDAVTVNELGHETFYRYTYIDGNASISASDSLGNGVTHIIYATGHITIKSNLTYSSGNLDDSVSIPQYIIIADGGIEISNNVDRVNAWLISPNSTINTCAEHTVAGGNSSITLIGNACEKQLRINGPVFAKTILLNRTFGAEPADPSASAEIFDMSATTFFWGYTQARDYAKAETVYTRELAPRY